MQICVFAPLAYFGIYAGLCAVAAGLISTVVVLVGGPRTAIRLPLAIFLVGIVVVAASTWLALADLSRPWSGNGEPPCPDHVSAAQ